MKRTGVFSLVFVAAMVPVYLLGLSGNTGVLLANIVIAFAVAALTAYKI